MYENVPFSLRKECRLRVFQYKALRQTVGPKREEAARLGELHNMELNNLYSSLNIFRLFI
jgi:hypothetical protein